MRRLRKCRWFSMMRFRLLAPGPRSFIFTYCSFFRIPHFCHFESLIKLPLGDLFGLERRAFFSHISAAAGSFLILSNILFHSLRKSSADLYIFDRDLLNLFAFFQTSLISLSKSKILKYSARSSLPLLVPPSDF